MNNLKNIKKIIFGIIICLCFVFIIFFAGMKFADQKAEPTISSTALTQQLKDINELATIEYHYTKVGKFENSVKINGWSVPLTKKRFLLAYAGILKAGVNMDEAKVTVQNHKITVKLPEVKILSNAIDEKSIEVYDESKNIFNPISVDDYKQFALQQKRKVEDEAIENGILSEASTKAQKSICTFLKMIPDIKENYKIEVAFK